MTDRVLIGKGTDLDIATVLESSIPSSGSPGLILINGLGDEIVNNPNMSDPSLPGKIKIDDEIISFGSWSPFATFLHLAGPFERGVNPVSHTAGAPVTILLSGSGIWVSKPTANVLAMVDANIPEDDWYGFQEEFDWVAEDGEWANSSPGVNRPYIPEGWVDGDPEASPFGFCTMARKGNSPGNGEEWSAGDNWVPDKEIRGKLKRTTNNTILYTGGYERQQLYSPIFVSANASQSAGGYTYWWHPYSGDVHPDAIFPPDYPVVEMRVRRLPTPNYPPPIHGAISGFGGGHDCAMFWGLNTITGQNPPPAPDAKPSGSHGHPTKVDGQSYTWDLSEGYTQIFPHAEISGGTPGPWRIVEWDLSNNPSWGGITNGEHRLHYASFYLTTANSGLTGTGSTGAAWNPETDPMWEIDYVRVKKASIPAGLGRWNSKQAAMLFDSDINHMGLVHQTGIVTIGTAKAWIDGTTSDRVVGHNIDNDANGYVSFPALDYIPLVLFQRIDENVVDTGIAFAEGEDEFSVSVSKWEDFRYPTVDMNTSEPSWKGFDMQFVHYGPHEGGTSLGQGELLDDEFSYKISSLAYFNNTTGNPVNAKENFYVATSDNSDGTTTNPSTDPLARRWNKHSSVGFGGTWDPANHGGKDSFPNWDKMDISSARVRRFTDSSSAGAKDVISPQPHWPTLATHFSEFRTFAYARAKKDGFWLTCRNAIAQEGMEPVLNLAPVLPEDGTANQGSAAYTSMASNNDNGAWGMFHPALALYDGQKFTEGLQLKWDTRTTANSFLIDKVGEDENGNFYDQYKWWPNFSCSGLIFNGATTNPGGDANSISRSDYPLSYTKSSGAGNDNAQYSANGILKGDTGGFYPYRYQYNHMYHRHFDISGTSRLQPSTGNAEQEDGMWKIPQWNVKRLSSEGIFHPEGTVPTNAESYNNKQVSLNQQVSYSNQVGTLVVGLAPGATGVVVLPTAQSGPDFDLLTAMMNSGKPGTIALQGLVVSFAPEDLYEYTAIVTTILGGALAGLTAFVFSGGTVRGQHSGHETATPSQIMLPVVSAATIENQTAYIGGAMNTKDSPIPLTSTATYDATKPKPPKYKYWVLRIPVSIPEYT